MTLSLVETLKVQRELLEVPRGMERFQKYLHELTGGTEDMILPLGLFNPMSKEHVAKLLDNLIDFRAEDLARIALKEVEKKLGPREPDFNVALIVTDDSAGQWTNRYFTEIKLRFTISGEFRRNWVTVPVWTSEPLEPQTIRRETLASVRRAYYLAEIGAPVSLNDCLIQEGTVARFAGEKSPTKSPQWAKWVAKVKPLLETEDFATIFAVLYGDEPAVAAGYTPLGLPTRFGYQYALELVS